MVKTCGEQFYPNTPHVPVVDVAVMELLREHREWERLERQRELVLLSLSLLVIATLALGTAHILLALQPTLSPVWLICVPLDMCGLLFLVPRLFFSRS